MGIYIEAIIIYIILFFAGSAGIAGNTAQEAVDFSVSGALFRIFIYYIPSISLILYLLFKGKNINASRLKPGKNDLVSGVIAFPCLLFIGFAIAFISQKVSGSVMPDIAVPSGVSDWVLLSLVCLTAAYLEEIFFRYYLITKKDELNMGAVSVIFFSTLLFALCHIYEGFWGILNSVICGAILALLFLRYKSLHGIAIAHGFYNIAVFAINSWSRQN